jgi:RNA polymerase sigma-70 factor (ECF subfamily)
MNSTEETTTGATRVGMQQKELVGILVSERVKMMAYIDSLVRDESLAEDIFQEVCMLAVEKADTINDALHLVKWLRTSARFHAMNAIQKRQQRIVPLDEKVMDCLEAQWQDCYDQDNTSDRTEALRHCVDNLPARAKDLIRKRYVEEMSYEQLATAVGRPVGSLYVTFSRIFASLGLCITGRLRSTGEGARG